MMATPSNIVHYELHLLRLPPEIYYYLFAFFTDIHHLLRLRETCIFFKEIALCAVKDLNLRKFAPNITDPVLANILSNCSDLQTLENISNCHVTDKIFSDIIRYCPRLTRLHAYNVVMTASCAEAASVVMPNLCELTLGRGASCSAVVCSHDTVQFSNLPHLTTLLFASSQLTTGALSALSQCRHLAELYLHDVVLSENGMGAITRIPSLKRLFLVRIRGLTDPGVAKLSQCETLEGLEIIKSETLTDAGIVPIAVCKSLKIICLEQTPNKISVNVKKPFQLRSIVVVLQN